MTTAALLFNPLRYAKKLVEAGFTEKQAEVQAEAQAEAISEIVDEKLATKLELEQVKSELKIEIELIRRDIKELDLKIESVKKDIIIKLGSMMVGGFTILSTLIVIFHR